MLPSEAAAALKPDTIHHALTNATAELASRSDILRQAAKAGLAMIQAETYTAMAERLDGEADKGIFSECYTDEINRLYRLQDEMIQTAHADLDYIGITDPETQYEIATQAATDIRTAS